MNFTVLRSENVLFVFNQIEQIKKIKGLPYLDLIFKLVDIKNIFKSKIEAIQEKTEVLTKERTSLILKYCNKKDEKPIIENGNYTGLDRGTNPDYDAASDIIIDSFKSLNKTTLEFSEDEKARLEKCGIDKKILEIKIVKEEFTGDMYEAIGYFINQ